MSQIDQNDPRLTAYALDEMSATERAAFEPLLRADPAARALVEDLRRTAALLAEGLAAEPLPARSVALHPPQRHWLRRLVTESWTLWVPLGAAACFGLFFWRVYLPEAQRREELAQRASPAARPAGIPAGATAVDLAALPAVGAEATAPARTPRPAAPTGLASADTTLKTGHFLTARQNPTSQFAINVGTAAFLTARQNPTSQFAINVGTAAYADVRRSLEAGERPPTGLVRIEELVNSFRYNYPRPTDATPVAVATEAHAAPWAKGHLLVRIGLQGRDAPGTASSAAAPGPSERPRQEAREILTAGAADEIRTFAARDVKVQVDFNPDKVLAYRLLGYENRLLKADGAEAVAANDLAAGRSVTALYEIIPLALPAPRAAVAAKPTPPPTPDPTDTAEWLTVKLRYTEPGVARSRSVIVPLHASVAQETTPPSADFKFAAAVAGFGLILQNNPNRGTASWDMVEQLAQSGLAGDTGDQRREFVSLVKKARELAPESDPVSTSPTPTP